MKLQPDKFDVQSISGYGPGWVSVGPERIHRSLILGSHGERLDWDFERFEQIDASAFEPIAQLGPELVIFGSGNRLRFPPSQALAPLARRGVGLETMDTAAACRTYNILAQEGRHVVVAILLESGGSRGISG